MACRTRGCRGEPGEGGGGSGLARAFRIRATDATARLTNDPGARPAVWLERCSGSAGTRGGFRGTASATAAVRLRGARPRLSLRADAGSRPADPRAAGWPGADTRPADLGDLPRRGAVLGRLADRRHRTRLPADDQLDLDRGDLLRAGGRQGARLGGKRVRRRSPPGRLRGGQGSGPVRAQPGSGIAAGRGGDRAAASGHRRQGRRTAVPARRADGMGRHAASVLRCRVWPERPTRRPAPSRCC